MKFPIETVTILCLKNVPTLKQYNRQCTQLSHLGNTAFPRCLDGL